MPPRAHAVDRLAQQSHGAGAFQHEVRRAAERFAYSARHRLRQVPRTHRRPSSQPAPRAARRAPAATIRPAPRRRAQKIAANPTEPAPSTRIRAPGAIPCQCHAVQSHRQRLPPAPPSASESACGNFTLHWRSRASTGQNPRACLASARSPADSRQGTQRNVRTPRPAWPQFGRRFSSLAHRRQGATTSPAYSWPSTVPAENPLHAPMSCANRYRAKFRSARP